MLLPVYNFFLSYLAVIRGNAVLATWDISLENGSFENNHPSHLVRANHRR